MLPIREDRFIGLAVITKAGAYVGKVCHFEVDANTLEVLCVEVKTSGMFAGIARARIRVARSQIISVDTTHVTVEDATVNTADKLRVLGGGIPASTPSLQGLDSRPWR